LTLDERGRVLDSLIAERPDPAAEAGRLAAELLGSTSIDQAASDVETALSGIPLDALDASVGPVRGRGYVDVHWPDWTGLR